MKILFILINFFVITFGKNFRNQMDWNVKNNEIFLNNGKINVKGITWNGFEGENFVLLGLWKHSLEFYIDQLKINNFNAIRIPLSSEFILNNTNTIPLYKTIQQDSECVNKTSLEILDLFFEKTERKNMLVVLNLNRLHKDYVSYTWFDKTFTNQTFYDSWFFILDRYKERKNLFAIDIYEEPQGSQVNFCNNNLYDWQLFSNNFINEINKRYQNKKWLFFFQGINKGNSFINYNCSFDNSIENRIIYTPHVFDNNIYDENIKILLKNLYLQWNQYFGFLKNNHSIMITKTLSKSMIWMQFLMNYLMENNLNNIFLYSLDNSLINGVLLDNWTEFDLKKLEIISNIQPNPTKIFY